MSQKRRRDPQREQFWREAVAEWEKSGESIRAFCAGRGLQEPSFYAWRRTLRERPQQRAPARPQASGPTLVPLRVIADPVLEVVLPAGVVVRVPVGAEAVGAATVAQLVAQLVAVLGSASC